MYVNSTPVPIYVLQEDVSDGFYRIGLKTSDTPNLILVLPTEKDEEPLVSIPLTLLLGWKNVPPIFCMDMETMANL